MEGMEAIGKGLGTIGLAIACSMWMYCTKKDINKLSGIGWFMFGLFLLW